MAIFKPNQVHQSKAITLEPLGYYGLHIDLEWYYLNLKKLFGSSIGHLDMKVNIVEDKDIYDELKAVFNNILSEDKSFEYTLENKIIDILRKYATLDVEIIKEENSFLCEVEKYILDNIDEQITLKDISLKIGYNESYITRIFKKKFGLTPHAFIVNKKINKAKKELQNSKDLSIAQLSNDVGFYDQSHLNKVFKRMHAISPNKYMNEE